MDVMPVFRAAMIAAQRDPDQDQIPAADIEAAREVLRSVDRILGAQLGETEVAQVCMKGCDV